MGRDGGRRNGRAGNGQGGPGGTGRHRGPVALAGRTAHAEAARGTRPRRALRLVWMAVAVRATAAGRARRRGRPPALPRGAAVARSLAAPARPEQCRPAVAQARRRPQPGLFLRQLGYYDNSMRLAPSGSFDRPPARPDLTWAWTTPSRGDAAVPRQHDGIPRQTRPENSETTGTPPPVCASGQAQLPGSGGHGWRERARPTVPPHSLGRALPPTR